MFLSCYVRRFPFQYRTVFFIVHLISFALEYSQNNEIRYVSLPEVEGENCLKRIVLYMALSYILLYCVVLYCMLLYGVVL